MNSLPIAYPPSVWTNQHMVLYHGTVDRFAAATLATIRVKLGKEGTDFGPGFYATSIYRQAHTWAAQMASKTPGSLPAVIELTITRESLAKLKALVFVRGDFDANDYWSFVHHCRNGATDHGRSHPHRYYDLVYGPVAAFWNQRMIIANSDQMSFHTAASEKVLNRSLRKRII